MTSGLTDQQLDDIQTRAAHLAEYASQDDGEGDTLAGTDVPVLLAEIRRLKQQRKLLLDQLARKDAASGAGDEALRKFLSDDDPAAPAL